MRAPDGVTVWDEALAGWYAENGRHHLPWRGTRDPWAVLVSEVMLQQTSVARVLPRWEAFLERWPDPATCAAAPLADVLREWQGLGYPRRARALHLSAHAVAEHGWPSDEASLRTLPGVGEYTAAALSCFAFGWEVPLPRDVNVDRVAARVLLGAEADQLSPAQRRGALAALHYSLDGRHRVYALFDLGALVCTARAPRCPHCPMRRRCASAVRLSASPPPARGRRQAPWKGSLRELRGAVLREALGPSPPASPADLARRVAHRGGAVDEARLRRAVDGLTADGLLPGFPSEQYASPAASSPRSRPGRLPPRDEGDNVTPPLPPDLPGPAYHSPVAAESEAQRVLIVDDDAGVRGYLRAALGRSGHEVVEAATAADAMAAIDAAPVGVMLIDGLLPDGHGLDLAAQVLDRPGGEMVGISFVTGAVREPVPPRDGIGALGKPVRPSELVAGVNELLAWRARGGGAAGDRRVTLDNLAARFLVGR